MNGTETLNSTERVLSVYYITLTRLVSTLTASSISVIKATTSATIAVDLPSTVQASAPPLTGYYRIKCIDPDGYESYSDNIYLNSWAGTVKNAISNGCDRLYDLVQVADTGDYSHSNMGKGFIIRFNGLNAQPGQFEIVTSETNPLSTGNFTTYSNRTVEYSSNLFYEPLPFEMLRTYETEPQLIVTVGGEPAVCHNLTCDFTYILGEGEITAFTYTEATKLLVITGTNLPSVIANISSVEYAFSDCTVDESTLSATNIECTLVEEPTCGDYKPFVISLLGNIPHATDLADQTILCSVTTATPNTDMNLLGGDNITISGEYLPHNLVTSTVAIKFSDS